MRYIKDKGSDYYNDILDFANMVFSMEYTGIDFSVYLPKAYSTDRKGITTHHMYLEDESDRIRALIDTYPLCLKMDGESINADYVGTVAVHPRFRGRGLFSKLMEKVEEEARADKTDLLIVDGERARYGNFEYEKAGMKYRFEIDYKCALNQAADTSPYEFEEVCGDEGDLVEKIYGIYVKRNVKARDINDFYISLLSLGASVFVVKKDGCVLGYVNLSENEKDINEFELDNMSDIPKLMLDLMEGFGMEKLAVTVGSDEIEKIKYLEGISSSYYVSTSHQIRILNYESVVGFLIRWKQKYCKLTDGEYTFGIKTADGVKNYKIAIKKGDTTVTRTKNKADDIFTQKEFVKVVTTGYFNVGYEKATKAPIGWFPLPFFLPEGDTF
jgi:GNAT superfamily N-acetyltransferase